MFAWILAKFGISKIPFIIIIALVAILGIGAVGSYYYIQHLDGKIQTLHDANYRQQLQISGLELQAAQTKKDIEAKDKAIATVQNKNATLNKHFDQLVDKLNKEELKKTTIANPSAAEQTVNQDIHSFNLCAGLDPDSCSIDANGTVIIK